MKKLRKRVISLLLACVMAFSLLPMNAWAVSQPTDESLPEEVKKLISELIADHYEIAGSGYYKLGSSDLYQIRYTKDIIDDQGFSSSDNVYIIVPGLNAVDTVIPNYSDETDPPWNDVVDRVYIAEGVTGIGDYAFYDQSSLKEVTIPSTVTSIGDYAFANNRAMTVRPATDVETGKTYVDLTHVTSIGEGAFQNCTSLAGDAAGGTHFGGGLTSVGASAFSGARPGELLFESGDLKRTLTIGNSAFSGASVRSVTFEDLGADSTMTIGKSAFSSNGLTALDLPEGLTEIGAYGFSGNRFEGILTLPDSLKSIGNYAFYVSTDSQNETLTELNLGTELQFVGEHAFCNYIGLATINVSTTHTNLELGEAAFGHDATDACTTGRVQDSSGEWLATGTTINIIGDVEPEDRETIAKKFENGVNCYTGEVSPLVLVDTKEATCLTDGTNTYHYYSSNNSDEPRTFYEPIEHLGHEWVEPKTIGESCDWNGGKLEVCKNSVGLNPGEYDDPAGGTATVVEDGFHYRFTPDSSQPATDHNYQPDSIEGGPISGTQSGQTTTLTYACTEDGHRDADDDDFNSYGGVIDPDNTPREIRISISSKVIEVDTLTTLGEVEEQLTGMVQSGAGSLSIEYDENQDKDDTLSAGPHTLTLRFTPSTGYQNTYTGMKEAHQFGKQTLQMTIQVEKIPLDFTDVRFLNAGASTSYSGNPVETTIDPAHDLPDGATLVDFEYYVDKEWRKNPPSRTAVGDYQVRAVIKYDPNIYTVPAQTHQDSNYKIEDTGNGQVTITAPYLVRAAALTGISVSALGGTFNGESSNRVQLYNVPLDSVISYTITPKNGTPGEENQVEVEGEDYNDTANVPIANLRDAGTYTVNITVTNKNYTSDPYTATVSFTIAKQAVQVPSAISGLIYNGEAQQGVAGGAEADPYTLGNDCSATNAGQHTGTVTLKEPNNTYWSNDESQSSATAKVSFTIAPFTVIVPTRPSSFSNSNPYNGSAYTAANPPKNPGAVQYDYNKNGELIGTWENTTVVTVTNARQTNAGTYSTVAQLNNPEDATNFVWVDTQNAVKRPLVSSWTIQPASHALPEITVDGDNSVEYTGKALDKSLIRFNGTTESSAYSLALVGEDCLTVSSYTWLNSDGSSVPDRVPIHVGKYRLQVTFALSEGAVRSNYRFTDGDPSANTAYGAITKTIPVEITKATLTLQAENDGTKTAVYTGSPITMPEVTIGNGLLDPNETVQLTYSYTWDENPEDETPPRTETRDQPFSFENVGTYTVSVEPAATSNYTAEQVTVTLTITQADQQVRLTAGEGTTLGGGGSEGNPYTVTKNLDDGNFFVTGEGYIDNDPEEDYDTPAAVTYSIQNPSDHNVATVTQTGPGAGQVTIQGAGTAVITVTADKDTTSGYDNYTSGSVSYTLTVNKGTPTITLFGTTFEAEYTGSTITGYEDLAEFSGVSGIDPSGDLIYTFYDDPGCADEDKVDNGLTGSINTNIPIDVGTYYLKVTYDGKNDPNYMDASAAQTITVTITPADVSGVTVTDYEDTYDGETHNMGEVMVNVPDSFEKGSYTVQFAESVTQPDADAGTGVWKDANEITFRNVSDSTNENTGVRYWYMVTFDGDNYAPVIGEVKVTISPATLTLSSTLPSQAQLTRPYDGTVELPDDQTPTDTSRGLLTDDGEIAVTAAYADKDAADSKNIVVTYTITFENGKAGNYTVSGSKTEGTNSDGKTVWTVTETVEGAGRITPKTVTVTVPDQIMTYSGDTVFTVGEGGIPCTVTGGVVPDEILNASIAAEKTGTAKSKDVVEDGNQITFAAVDVDLAADNDGTNADNYQVVDPVTAGLTIEAKEITLRFPEAKDGVINTSYTTEPVDSEVYAAEIRGMVGSDTSPSTDNITYTFYTDADCTTVYGTNGKTPPSAVGEYWVKAEVNGDPAVNANYTSAEATAKLVISTDSQVALKVTPDAYRGTYDGDSHDAANSVKVQADNTTLMPDTDYTIYYTTTDPGDAKRLDPSAYENNTTMPRFTNADTYTVYYLVDAKNYNDAASSFTVQIGRAQLDITSEVTLVKPYDGNNTAAVTSLMGTAVTAGEPATATVSGKNGETFNVTASAVYNSADITGASPITVTYKLTPNGDTAKLSNYTVRINGGKAGEAKETMTETLTEGVAIIPRPITVTILNDGKVYDGQVPTASSDQGTGWKIAKGTVVAGEKLGVTLTIDAPKADVDTYDISGDWGNTNYNVTFAGESGGTTGTYTITPRPVNIAIGDASGVYGDDPDLTDVVLTDSPVTGEDQSGLVGNETLTLNLDTDAESTSAAGREYEIYALNGGTKVVPGSPFTAGNYSVTITRNGTYNQQKRPITITIADKESAYGCDIAELSSTVAYTGDSGKAGIVNDDNLGIDLTTTASNTSDVGTYPITGKTTAGSDVTGNYDISWAGSRDGETAGTYTIREATLTIEFSNETVNVSIGNQVENPLKFINASNDNQELSGQPGGVTVQYESSDEKVATVNGTTGAVTIVGIGDAIITATVTSGGQNFTGGDTASYELRVATASAGIQVSFPTRPLTYNGKPQNLLGTPMVSPEGATVQYRIRGTNDWLNSIPTKTAAGTYYVEWRASASGYSDVSGTQQVIIEQAPLSGRFVDDNPQTTFTENGTYGNTENPLTLPADYQGTVQYYSTDASVASVDDIDKHQLTIHDSGTVTINAVCSEDQNYRGATFSYTLIIGAAETIISVTKEEGYTGTYDGVAHQGAVIKYNAPDGAEIRYEVDGYTSYPLTEAPTFTNAGQHTVYYQITAPGCTPRTGSVEVNIAQREITAEMFAGSIAASYTYTGSTSIQPPVTVTYNGMVLEESKDYTVSYGDNNTVGEDEGSVTVTYVAGGNYTGSDTVYFDITPIEGTVMTAKLAPSYGIYQDGGTRATVTVTHVAGAESHEVDLTDAQYTFTATGLDGNPIDNDNAMNGSGDTLTFTEVGVYNITLTLTGSHAGTFHMTYTLLPMTGGDGELTLTVDGSTQKVYTYGDVITDIITVMAGNTDVTSRCKLTYVYTGFDGRTANGDYSVGMLKDAGVYTVTATPIDSSAQGTGTFIFLIQQRSLAEATLKVVDDDLVYNQQAQKPDVTVTVTGSPTVGTDYTVNYYNNVNATVDGELAQVLITATGNNFTGSKAETFGIARKSIADPSVVIGEIGDQHFTGQPIVPQLTITDGAYSLVLGYDYTASCEDVGPGEATVTVTGIGNYQGTTTKTFTIISESDPQPTERFTLTVTPDTAWTYGSAPDSLALEVKFGDNELTNYGGQYTLLVDGTSYDTYAEALAAVKELRPGTHTVTAQGAGAYEASSSEVTITIAKIQPEVSVVASPVSLSGSGTVTLTLSGSNLSAGTDLTALLRVDTANGTTLDLTQLTWTQAGSEWTASFNVTNANETYTFTLEVAGSDYYEAASDTATVVTARRTGGGVVGGGTTTTYTISAEAGTGGTINPNGDVQVTRGADYTFTISASEGYAIDDVIVDGASMGAVSRYTFENVREDHTIEAVFVRDNGVADPDETGVSNWLNTVDHFAYLSGYPGDLFGPDNNMTRAEAAQMFYNLLLNKDVPTTVTFVDVDSDTWYADAVHALASLSIINGVGDNRYEPERAITRAEFTVMATRFAHVQTAGVDTFSDVNESDWFFPYVATCVQYGWIDGYPDGTFRPDNSITRSEVTTIVNRMLGRSADSEYVDDHTGDLTQFNDVEPMHWAYYQIMEAANAHDYIKSGGMEDWTGLN